MRASEPSQLCDCGAYLFKVARQLDFVAPVPPVELQQARYEQLAHPQRASLVPFIRSPLLGRDFAKDEDHRRAEELDAARHKPRRRLAVRIVYDLLQQVREPLAYAAPPARGKQEQRPLVVHALQQVALEVGHLPTACHGVAKGDAKEGVAVVSQKREQKEGTNGM